MSPALIFAMNAVAIVPLAGLLSSATESVASRFGDSRGALLNITLGNTVELIIFIIALVKNEIRIVQASLLGSILANLLLILGMSFFLGGLRFREQIYNHTVTQLSACLLSLSVISLVLPTAFHASFSDSKLADAQSLKISRGTSVILLLVYIIYLLFILVSHKHMYESTPQHIIDEECIPGPAANWLDMSNSSDSSSSDDSDSTNSEHSRDTVRQRFKRARAAMRGSRRRESIVSVDTSEGLGGPTRTPSFTTADATPMHVELKEDPSPHGAHGVPNPDMTLSDESESAVEDERPRAHKSRRRRLSRKHHKQSHKTRRPSNPEDPVSPTIHEHTVVGTKPAPFVDGTRRIDFATVTPTPTENPETKAEKLPSPPPTSSQLFGDLLRPVAKSLTPPVFQPRDGTMLPGGRVPPVRMGIRRTNSLPDRLDEYRWPSSAVVRPQTPLPTTESATTEKRYDEPITMSRTSAIILLLFSTGLVAVCAEFMVDSINGLVETSSIGEAFIGLIILPIVGNAAEHVTAVTVAMKNKMDLAIGVAVGSSIQIALFITPLVVMIGWIMDRQMTLYFTLFETGCLFVSTFITNFLVLDGRSNYLEGALLVATYVIISVVAFFYPHARDTSSFGA